ncbi:MAG: hypothetical protein R3260_17875 [Pseudomonas sp.]|nr:hypothetical protein [Pseudomonas sp.]
MDNQEAGPMTQDDVHSKFLSVLDPSTKEDSIAAPSEEQGQTVESTEAEEAEAAEVEATEAESNESEATEQPQEQPAEAPLYTVKVNGEDKQVTLEELQSGFMMQSDYSRKTQEAAEARKAFQQEMAQAQQERAAKMQELSERVSRLDQLAEAMQSSVDLEQLRDLDPSEYLKHTENMEKLRKSAEEQRQFLIEQQKAQIEQMRAAEQEKLMAVLPDWLDADKAKAGSKRVREAFGEYQFNDQEIGSLMDHRLIHMAHDLAVYKQRVNELESKASQVREQVQNAAPLSKPQNNVSSDEKARRMKKLRGDMRKGSDGAAAEAFKNIL